MRRAAWRWVDDFFFRPTAAAPLVAARVIVSGVALWILLSRPQLPSAVAWPHEFWSGLPKLLLVRFGYFGQKAVEEWILYVVLCILLVAVMFGTQLRFTAFAAGLLLYHFAPLDEMFIQAEFAGVGGLTLPTIGMFILAATDTPKRDAESSGHRWPVAMLQLILALSVLLPGIAKLRYSGISWYTGANLQRIALTMSWLGDRPLARLIEGNLALAWAIAIGSAILDFGFVMVLVSRRARLFFVPLSIIGLIVRSAAFGCHWLAAPMLLLFADWERLRLKKAGD